MVTLIVFGVIIFLLAYTAAGVIGYGIRLYNNLVSMRNDCLNAKAGISLLMKQRHDELPKLVGCCSQYMGHENQTLVKVAEARGAVASAKNAAQSAQAEGQLHAAIGALFATVEAYPNLKADEMFQNLQSRISMLERDISDKRLSYNGEVNLYNTRIGQWPDNLIAARYGFSPMTLLEFDAGSAELADVNIKAEFVG